MTTLEDEPEFANPPWSENAIVIDVKRHETNGEPREVLVACFAAMDFVSIERFYWIPHFGRDYSRGEGSWSSGPRISLRISEMAMIVEKIGPTLVERLAVAEDRAETGREDL